MSTDLIIQHDKTMRGITCIANVFSYFSDVPKLSTFSHHLYQFQKKIPELKICVPQLICIIVYKCFYFKDN